MNEVVILIPVINLPKNPTEEQLVLFMANQVEQLINLGAIKGTVDDIIKDYTYDEMTNYLNITVPQDTLGLTNELEVVGAAECPTYKVPDGMLNYVDAATGEMKSFSAATIKERLRIAMRNPKLRFRYTILDYKRYYAQNKSRLESNEAEATKLKNMFLTDVMGMFVEILPLIEEGKQLATLVGTSQVTPKLNKIARELSIAYRRALKMEKTGQISKSIYTRLKKAYTEFMQILTEQVFPGLDNSGENADAKGELLQKAASRRYSRCSDGRIDLFSEPNPDQMEREAEEDALNEETRALNEDLEHLEEESQKEYSGSENIGELMYIIAKYVPDGKHNAVFYDLVSDVNSEWDDLSDKALRRGYKKGNWYIYKMTEPLRLHEALNEMRRLGVKYFSESLKENIKQSGKTFSDNSDDYYVVVHQNGIVDSWFGPYFHNEAEKVEDEVVDELDAGFSVGIWNLDTLLSKLNKQRKGNYDAKLVKSHADKRNFSESREKVSAEMLEKAKTDGVVQKKPNGSWGIISIDAGEWWTADYDTEEDAKSALAAYHANK